MSNYRDRREQLLEEEMQDVTIRRNTFRGMARDFLDDLRSGHVTDAPGEIARMMEKAFKSGFSLHEAQPTIQATTKTTKRRFTDKDVSSNGIWVLHHLRLRWLGYGLRKEPSITPPYSKPALAALFLEHNPERLGYMHWTAHTETTSLSCSISEKYLGNLRNLGLVEEKYMSDGKPYALFTEWGYELLVTGETAMPANRKAGQSRTVEDWKETLAFAKAAVVKIQEIKAEKAVERNQRGFR